MPSAAEVPMIEVEHLTVGYGDTVVLEDLDFTVPRGDVFAILGGSGSGKSTLLRALIGLEEPMRGTVRIAGAPPAREGPPRYGVLFQSGALFGSMTLAENGALPPAKWTSLDPDAIDTVGPPELRLGGPRGFENHLPAAISGGLTKRPRDPPPPRLARRHQPLEARAVRPARRRRAAGRALLARRAALSSRVVRRGQLLRRVGAGARRGLAGQVPRRHGRHGRRDHDRARSPPRAGHFQHIPRRARPQIG